MSGRVRGRGFAAAGVLFCVLASGRAPDAGEAGSHGAERSSTSASTSWLGFLSFRTAPPAELEDALASHREGRDFRLLADSVRLRDHPDFAFYRDDVAILRARALARLGWHDAAASALVEVLEQDPPSPYHPLALLHLLEAHRSAGRRDALLDAYRRWFEAPWQGRDRRSLAIRNAFFAYGDLREGSGDLLEEERQRLLKPETLGERRRRPKERPSDRLVHLAATELLAAGAHRESLRASQRIGVASPYHRYALYAAAQNRFALGDGDGAVRSLRWLVALPVSREVELALRDRARLLLARILAERGAFEDALRFAEEPGGIGFVLEAALLRGDILQDLGRPALAAVAYRDVVPSSAPSEARRALGLGAALRALGDPAGAAEVLREAADRLGRERAALDPAKLDARIEALASRVEERARHEREAERAERRREAEGIRRVLEFEGPWTLGRAARVVFTSHENTLLGEKVYDVRKLAEAEAPPAWVAPTRDPLWLAGLASPHRVAIDAAARRLIALEESPEATLLALDAALRAAEGAYPGEPTLPLPTLTALAPEGFAAADPPGPHDAARFREWTLTRSTVIEAAAPNATAVGDVASLLRGAIRAGLLDLARDEAELLRSLELDLAIALSDALHAHRTALRRP